LKSISILSLLFSSFWAFDQVDFNYKILIELLDKNELLNTLDDIQKLASNQK
jgi:hypothetical protein